MARSEQQKLLDRITRARRHMIQAVELFADAKVDFLPGHIAEMRRRLEAAREEIVRLIVYLEKDVNNYVMAEVKDLKAGDRTPWYEVLEKPESRPEKAFKWRMLVKHFDTGHTDHVWGWGDEKVPIEKGGQ